MSQLDFEFVLFSIQIHAIQKVIDPLEAVLRESHEVSDDEVTVDGNHPLAGKTLTFNCTVTNIRKATEEELEHGHVHEEGSHTH